MTALRRGPCFMPCAVLFSYTIATMRREKYRMLSRDQILFYGGALLAAAALIWLIVSLIRYRIAARRLDDRLDAEYGKRIR